MSPLTAWQDASHHIRSGPEFQNGFNSTQMTSASKYLIYHNPRCSKSRETLKLLQAHNIEPNIIEYLKTPPAEKELKALLRKLGLAPRDLLRKKEKEYKAAGLDNPALTDDELIALMVANPRVIERPIVVSGNKAVIGRPPENVLELIKA